MIAIKNLITQKLKSRRGISLVEVLVTTLILLLVSAVMVSVVSLACRQFIHSVATSEAQELYSTLEMAMYNDLSYVGEDTYLGNKIECDASGNVKSYRSTTYSVEDTQNVELVVLDETGSVTGSGYGELALGSGSVYNRVVGSSSYPNGLGVMVKEFTYDASAKEFTLTLSIGEDGEELFERTFTAKALNR